VLFRSLPALERIGARGRDNGIACTDIGPEQLKEIEPNCAGIRAIQVHDAGIADYVGVCEKLASLIEGAGGEVVMGSAVEKVRTDDECVRMSTSDREFTASAGVNCAGLHSDRVAELSGIKPEVRILPFRGEYFVLRPEAEKLVNNLIYPVPDPRYPFLGVHYTRMIKGGIECGPNAVLALSREGYTWGDADLRDLAGIFGYPGFWAFSKTHWRAGVGEVMRSLRKPLFLASLQKLVPSIRDEDIVPGPAGVRAQAITRDGKLLDDFSIIEDGRMVHVCNAPSPAATSSLSIGESIAQRVMAVLA